MKRTFMLWGFFLIQLNIIVNACTHVDNNDIESIYRTDVFQKGENGYACFRIPAIVETKAGTLLAFAEARKNSCSDTGDIDLIVKRSKDKGKTWGEIIIIHDDGNNTCGNPAPIVDEQTGRIILLSCWNSGSGSEEDINNQTYRNGRRVFVSYSDNDGLNWSIPKEITSDVKKDNWTWYATGPCHGIQLQGNKYKNRFIIPSNHIEAKTKETHSHIIYSDDGINWKLGGSVIEKGGNESSAVELQNGNVMLNMRNYNREESKTRSYSISSDGGSSWSAMYYAPSLIEPICQGSILNGTKQGKITNTLYFSNPASITKREMMTIKKSTDSGETWPYSYLVYYGPSAYSDMVMMDDTHIGLLFEYGETNAYEKIGFTVIPTKELNK